MFCQRKTNDHVLRSCVCKHPQRAYISAQMGVKYRCETWRLCFANAKLRYCSSNYDLAQGCLEVDYAVSALMGIGIPSQVGDKK